MEQLIEEVRKYPCLWNKSKEEYRNQNIRENAWERLSGELEEPGIYISNFNFIVIYSFLGNSPASEF